MLDAILDAVIDSLKLLPFLFVTYLLMEYMEDKLGDKSKAALKKAGNVGPLFGHFSPMRLLGNGIKYVCRKGDHHGHADCGVSVDLG